MINFGTETIDRLAYRNYTVEDIAWIGTYEFVIPTNEFFDVARHTWYDNGFGGVEIPQDLLIVMKDGSWFSREEYDGSEWWQYNIIPFKPTISMHLKVKNFLEPNYSWDPTLIKACMTKKEV